MKKVNRGTIINMPWWYKIFSTQGIHSYPCKTKTSQETYKNLQQFLEPTKKPKVIYTDNEKQPSKKSKKSGGERSVALLKESKQLVCVFQAEVEVDFTEESEKLWGQITPPDAPKARYTTSNFGKEGVHRKELFKSADLKSAICALPSLRRRHKTKPCNKSDAPAEKHGVWRNLSIC